MEFDQYLGFILFLTVLTMGFWLMILLLTFIIPYWVSGAFFERMKLDNLDQAKMLVEVDIKKRDVKEVVNEWLDNNPDKWKSWLPN